MATNPSDMMDVLSLQDIVFDKIFPLLSMKDIFQLRAVSKKYNSRVAEYFQTQTKVVIDESALKDFRPKADCVRPINLMAANTGKASWNFVSRQNS